MKSFLKYAKAKEKEMADSFAFRVYVTDILFYKAQGKTLVKRYCEIINPEPVDKRSGDEIAKSVIEKAGLRLE